MDNPRPEKVAVVEEVRERLDGASAAILTEYRGLSVKDMATLRRSLTEAGGSYKVYKNTLVGFAARELGLTELEAMLTGPTAIAFVQGDAVNVAKTLRDFARTHPHLVVKGGLLGTRVLSSADAAALADVAPRDVLLARLAGALAAPMVQFAGLLQALPRNFAYGLKALIEKGGAAGDAAGTAPAAPPAAEAPGEDTDAAAPADADVADAAPAAEVADTPTPAADAAPAADPEIAAEAAPPAADAAPAAAATEADAEADTAGGAPDPGTASTEEPVEGAPPADDAGPSAASSAEPAEGASDDVPPADPTTTTA